MAKTLINAVTTPTATTDTRIYTVPAATSAVLSNISICNRSGASGTFRIYIKKAGATAYYLLYEIAHPYPESFSRKLGDVLLATDEVWVRASAANFDFILSGQENS